jgi:predicted solute-binding protein
MTNINFCDEGLAALWNKVHVGERLSLDDGLVLFGTNDLASLGKMAEVVQQRINGDAVSFILRDKNRPDVHKTAHRPGAASDVSFLCDRIGTYRERLDRLLRLRELQDETGGFLAFNPFPHQYGITGAKPPYEPVSAADMLKTIAVSRLILDNIPHIKADLDSVAADTAASALHFGIDDMEGAVDDEENVYDAAAASPMPHVKERMISIIINAGKIPVERDDCYLPLDVHSENVIGKIPYLNSFPFYNYFEKGKFKLLPVVPRHMGILSDRGRIIAGPFSFMDYLAQENTLEMMDYCIAAHDRVRSILLFSRYSWPELQGKKIGIMDDTATSVHLLRVLLEGKYSVKADLVRMPRANRDYRHFDAFLLIGDEALKYNKCGQPGFQYIFDLATEWHDWQQLPFVFAVWAQRKSLPAGEKKDIKEAIGRALAREKREPSLLSALHGRRLGLTETETATYLDGIIYHLGDEERAAIKVFRKLAAMD